MYFIYDINKTADLISPVMLRSPVFSPQKTVAEN